jgi:hypothetical protein
MAAGDTVEAARDAFVDVAAGWSARTGVDRRTLMGLGVEGAVLDEAGVQQPLSHEVVRGWWPTGPFTAADLARRSGLSEPTVRRAIACDESAGLLRRTAGHGRAVLWERTD